MGLKEVEADISQRIEKEVSEIREAGKSEAERILDNANENVRNLKKAKKEELERTEESIRKREKAQAGLIAKRTSLKTKKELMDELHVRVIDALSKMPASEKEALLTTLLNKARSEIEAHYVYSNEDDKALVMRLANGLDYGGTIECTGGIIVEDVAKELSANYTFDLLLKKVERSHLKNITQKLFK